MNTGFREVVALFLLGLFGYAYFMNPHNEAIIGALLTSFATAVGFYLGGSKVGSDTAEKNAASVIAQAAVPTIAQTDSGDVNVGQAGDGK